MSLSRGTLDRQRSTYTWTIVYHAIVCPNKWGIHGGSAGNGHPAIAKHPLLVNWNAPLRGGTSHEWAQGVTVALSEHSVDPRLQASPNRHDRVSRVQMRQASQASRGRLVSCECHGRCGRAQIRVPMGSMSGPPGIAASPTPVRPEVPAQERVVIAQYDGSNGDTAASARCGDAESSRDEGKMALILSLH